MTRHRYVHADWEAWRYSLVFGRARPTINMYPARFENTPKRNPVKGGRWGVRKLAGYRRDGKYWSAYIRGSLNTLSRSFITQAEAIAYAQHVARLAAGGGL